MSNWDKGSTSRWRRIRRLVLARDGWRCRMGDPNHPIGRTQPRSPHCTGKGEHAHHTLGRGVTGDDERYLVTSCAPCNLAAGDPTRHDPPGRSHSNW